jgi:hypothetical protein
MLGYSAIQSASIFLSIFAAIRGDDYIHLESSFNDIFSERLGLI